MTIAVSPPIPADIKPPEVDLAATAILLRAGLYAEEVPSYPEASIRREISRIAHTMTWRPFLRTRP